jgi:hypothetical protein
MRRAQGRDFFLVLCIAIDGLTPHKVYMTCCVSEPTTSIEIIC